jgi:hypothetical protein
MHAAVITLILIILFTNGCSSSSVLIRSDDLVFKQAQQALERVNIIVDVIKPPLEEKVLFLQAESFCRYRFEPPKKSKMSYLAEGAASTTDFSAFSYRSNWSYRIKF